MDTFLSRIKSTVRSGDSGGAGSGKGTSSGKSGKGGKSAKAGKSGTASGGKSGKSGGRSKSAAAKSRPAAGPKSGGRAGTRPKGRSKTASTAKGRPAKKPAAGGSKDGAGQAAGTRQGPSMPVRVLAMLVAFAAMVAFAGVLSRLTLEPSAASEAIAHTNLEPGSTIRAYLSQPAFQDTVKQLGGNIVLGVPFGVLLPVLIPRARGFLRVTVATALVMFLVELVQGALITGRAFDIDDVILNSTGAFLGYLLLGRWLGRRVHPPRRRWWQRWIRGPVAN